MLVLPAGSFTMGTPSDPNQSSDEGPPRRVSVASFALGKYEVTRREFQYFLDQTGAKRADGCMPVGGKDHAANEPEVCLDDVLTMGFLKWLSAKSAHSYRLPTDVEWEYAARGGTSTLRFWGNEPSRACQFANVSDRSAKRRFNWDGVHACDDRYPAVAPVGKFPPNPFGLHDILGNVSEIVREGLRRGGSYGDGPAMVTAASRQSDDTSDWSTVGIRVARAAPGNSRIVEPDNAAAARQGGGTRTGSDADDSHNQGTTQGRPTTTKGSIAGQVTDNAGSVIPGVWVTLTGPVPKGSKQAIVSAKGHYEFAEVPSGEYSVKFELPGFETVVKEGIHVRGGEAAAVDVRLRVSTLKRK
jgi:hypothetical protein